MYILGPSPFDKEINESFNLFVRPNLPRGETGCSLEIWKEPLRGTKFLFWWA